MNTKKSKVNRKSIENAIKAGHVNGGSIAEHMGVTYPSLYQWCLKRDLMWLIPPGQIDHGAINRAIKGGCHTHKMIAYRLSTRVAKVTESRVQKYMQQHGLKLVIPKKTVKEVINEAPMGLFCGPWHNLHTNHQGKEFPRKRAA